MTIIPLSKPEAATRTEHRVPLKALRLRRSKAAFSTHRVDWNDVHQLLLGDITPRSGDLLLARVDRLGQHRRLELACGRRAHLHIGDEVVVCYGGRYAPDQFEAVVPDDLGRCDLVAAGGIAARCRARHAAMKTPTRIEPVGLLADASGRRINLNDYALSLPSGGVRPGAAGPAVYGVLGTMMNAGKTTAAAMLVRGLRAQGLRVGAVKVTGTGAGCDRWVYLDAGADAVLDFTDLGEPSTYGLATPRLEQLFTTLVALEAAAGMDSIVVEVADGLFQAETAALLASPVFRERCDGVLFASRDALGALAGVAQLRQLGLPVLAVSGALTASPLATREAAAQLDIAVLTAEQLSSGSWSPLPDVKRQREEA